MNKQILAITQRIVQRSKETREQYLADMKAAH